MSTRSLKSIAQDLRAAAQIQIEAARELEAIVQAGKRASATEVLALVTALLQDGGEPAEARPFVGGNSSEGHPQPQPSQSHHHNTPPDRLDKGTVSHLRQEWTTIFNNTLEEFKNRLHEKRTGVGEKLVERKRELAERNGIPIRQLNSALAGLPRAKLEDVQKITVARMTGSKV